MLYRPEPHDGQETAAEEEYRPAMQLAHEMEPKMGEYFPEGQAGQLAEPVLAE